MKMLLTVLVIVIVCSLSGCSYTSIAAGEEGVMIYKPWFLGRGGVDSDPIKTGAIWTAMSTSVARYNIKPTKIGEHFEDLTASDNVAIDFDVYLTLKVQNGKSPKLHELSGRKWYVNKVQDTFRAYVRNEARTKSSIDLRTDENTIVETQNTIRELMVAYIKEIDLPVDVIKVNIGKVVPPEEVLAEAAQTAAQKQRKQTQDQRKITEDARAAAETSAALADRAYSKEFNMTTDQFLRNKELDIMAHAVLGGSNVSLIINASGAQPVIQLGR